MHSTGLWYKIHVLSSLLKLIGLANPLEHSVSEFHELMRITQDISFNRSNEGRNAVKMLPDAIVRFLNSSWIAALLK